MAELLQKGLDQVDREYNELPACKRSEPHGGHHEKAKGSDDGYSPPNFPHTKTDQFARRLSVPRLPRSEVWGMGGGGIYWTGGGRGVFALPENRPHALMRYPGTHEQNPTLDLSCREVFARGQKLIVVAGPFLEDEAGKVHEGFW